MWGPSAGADGPLCAVGLAVAAETGKPVPVALRADVERVFPAQRKLVRDVEALFPADRLMYLSDRAVRLPEAMRSLVGPILDDAARR